MRFGDCQLVQSMQEDLSTEFEDQQDDENDCEDREMTSPNRLLEKHRDTSLNRLLEKHRDEEVPFMPRSIVFKN